jgi:hypothetical protein
MNIWVKVGAIAGVLAGLAIPASATPITMQVVAADTAIGGYMNLLVDGATVNDFVGGIKIKLDGVAYEALCVDLFHSIGIETIQVNPFSPFESSGWARAAWLYVNVLPGVHTVSAGEALQLAVWDIVHDGGDGFNAGRLRANTAIGTPQAVLDLANTYLSNSLSKTSGTASIYISVDGPTAKQALLSAYVGAGTGWTPPSGQQTLPTPEPSTLALSGFALAATLGLALRRRRAKQATRS